MKFDNPFARLPVVMVFFFIIALPLANSILHLRPEASRGGRQKMERVEKRSPDTTSVLQRHGRNFADRIFLRGNLIHIHNSLKYRIFGVSGVPQAIIGKKGWLFQARVNENPGTAGYFPSIGPFTPEELDQWRRSLLERQRWLRDRGIEYLFIPVPDKSSIYPEYLPENLRVFYRRSRLDQLIEFLKKTTSLQVLDIRPALRAAKIKSAVYAKTDSHWNDFGARIVSGEISNYLAARFGNGRGVALPEYQVKTGRERPGGNLAMMLTLENSFFREERSKAYTNVSLRAVKADLPPVRFSPSVAAEATQNGTAPFANAVMFHDSFGRKLKPFLAELFTRIVFIRDWGFGFAGAVVEKERPMIVLDEIAEHFLYNLQLVNDFPGKNGI